MKFHIVKFEKYRLYLFSLNFIFIEVCHNNTNVQYRVQYCMIAQYSRRKKFIE